MSGKWRLRAELHRPITADQPQRPPKQLHERVGKHTRTIARHISMSSPLLDVWEAASSTPFNPAIGKGSQFTAGIVLLFICMFGVAELSWSCANNAQRSS
jgi:hypothetical protein